MSIKNLVSEKTYKGYINCIKNSVQAESVFDKKSYKAAALDWLRDEVSRELIKNIASQLMVNEEGILAGKSLSRFEHRLAQVYSRKFVDCDDVFRRTMASECMTTESKKYRNY